jgi:hypothetical protein
MRAGLEYAHHANGTNHTAGESEHVAPIDYPITPFDSILSDDGISVGDGTFTAVVKYLNKAHQLNATVSVLQSATVDSQRTEPTMTIKRFIKDQADIEMNPLITNLENALNCEH